MRRIHTEEKTKNNRISDREKITRKKQNPKGRRHTKHYGGNTSCPVYDLLCPFTPQLGLGHAYCQDVIRNGIIEEYIQTRAVLIRDEELLRPSSIDGIYIPEIHEGEKTAAYSCIAMVMGSESDELLKDIDDINAKIVKARMEQAEKAEFFSADLAKLDDEIGVRVRNLIAACNTRNFEEMGRQRAEIRSIVEKKAEIAAEDSTDEYITSLLQKNRTLQNMIEQNTVRVMTSASGVVSYCIDGYEGILTPDRLRDLTVNELDSIREKSASVPLIQEMCSRESRSPRS